MLCQKCNKNQANVHLVKLVNGEKSDVWLCEECARKISDKSLGMSMVNLNQDSFQSILGDFFDNLDKKNKKPTKEINIDVVCKKCNMTYSKFKETGKVGCGECYNSFSDFLEDDIKKMQGSSTHIGKSSVDYKKNDEMFESVEELKRELKRAISEEAYERAAVIRDKIKFLQDSNGGIEAYEKLDS